MKLDSHLVLDPAAPAQRHGGTGSWAAAAAITIAAVIALVLIYLGTAASIAAIWHRSETFAHGYLIVPISAWLIWTRRHAVARLAPQPGYWGLILMAGAGMLWLTADVAQVQVVRQFALVAMIPALVITVLGPRVAWTLAFPLGFLLLAVPVGEELIPPLMDFTADFTVTALRLTGIPVFREGTFFTIPSGQWSVVEGCSGLRYLIASITAGVLYAYLTYRSLARRLAFIALSIIVPIIANGLRAYMIVMIAHLSDMKLALGIDHLIYGWVFFGIVMFALFWAGSFWSEQPADMNATRGGSMLAAQPVSVRGVLVASLAAIAVAALWPAYAAFLERNPVSATPIALQVPPGANGWSPEATEMTVWRPRHKGADASVFQGYRKGEQRVVLYLGYYRNQRQDAELINSQNVMVVQKDPVWSNVGESRRPEKVGDTPVDVRQTKLRSAPQRLLVWDWLSISDRYLTDPYLAKILLARDKLLGRGDDGAAIIVATPYEEGIGAPDATLREFTRDMLPSIEGSLSTAAR